MTYRIRYEQGQMRQNEMVLEANSPVEAMIKFQHTRPDEDRSHPSRVTSVQPDRPDPVMS